MSRMQSEYVKHKIIIINQRGGTGSNYFECVPFGFSCLRTGFTAHIHPSQPFLPITPLLPQPPIERGKCALEWEFSEVSGWKIRKGDCETFLQNSINLLCIFFQTLFTRT